MVLQIITVGIDKLCETDLPMIRINNINQYYHQEIIQQLMFMEFQALVILFIPQIQDFLTKERQLIVL